MKQPLVMGEKEGHQLGSKMATGWPETVHLECHTAMLSPPRRGSSPDDLCEVSATPEPFICSANAQVGTCLPKVLSYLVQARSFYGKY